MGYQAPIRGRIIKKPLPLAPRAVDLVDSVLNSVQVMNKVMHIKQDLESTVDKKLTQVDETITDVLKDVEEKTRDFAKAKTLLEEATEEILDQVATITQGPAGADADHERIVGDVYAKMPTEEQIAKSVLKKIPKTDSSAIVKEVLGKIPKQEPVIAHIQEQVETDPMSVIDRILELPEVVKKLKHMHTEGLEQTISAFRNQTARGYLHGGGLSAVSTDATLTGNGTPQDPLHVVGGGSTSTFVDNEIVSGAGTSWNLALVPLVGTVHVYGGGARLYPNGDYTIVGQAITTTNSYDAGQLLCDYQLT